MEWNLIKSRKIIFNNALKGIKKEADKFKDYVKEKGKKVVVEAVANELGRIPIIGTLLSKYVNNRFKDDTEIDLEKIHKFLEDMKNCDAEHYKFIVNRLEFMSQHMDKYHFEITETLELMMGGIDKHFEDVKDILSEISKKLDDLGYKIDDGVEKIIKEIDETQKKKGIEDKKPDLELYLIDENDKETTKLTFQPIFYKENNKKKEELPHYSAIEISEGVIAQNKVIMDTIQSSSIHYDDGQEVLGDTFPIRIGISNNGEIPAEEINIFLSFSDELILSEQAVYDGLASIITNENPTYKGINIKDKKKNNAYAWKKSLGNDLSFNDFDKIYVTFPNIEKDFKLNINVTQNSYPSENFEFILHSKPVEKEKIEYK